MAATIIGLVGAAGVVYFGYPKVQPRIFKRDVRTTEIALISPSQAEVQVTATGYVIPQRTSKVGANVPGRLAVVLVKEGDTVEEGDVIARLDDADQRSQLLSGGARIGAANARVSAARANLLDVTQEVEREQALVKSGTTAQARLDTLLAREEALKSMLRAAESERNAAHAEYKTLDVGVQDRLVLAPISGRIVSKPATVGEYVGGIATMAPIAEIVDFSSLMVEAEVPEGRLHLIKMGMPCEIVLDAEPGKRYRGEAVERGHRVNRAKATLVVKVKFTDPFDDVVPEMSARVSFLSKAITDEALSEAPKRVVARDAVAERDGQKVVFAVQDGALQAIPVKLGEAVGSTTVELLDGPPPGTKIILAPPADAADGQAVREASSS